MANDRSDPFRMWSDLALMGVRAYASTVAAGLETASRMVPASQAFPMPAIRRPSPVAMWPAAGSFGSNNAVGAWVDATQAMMGVRSRPAPFAFPMPWASLPWNPFMPLPATWPMGMPWGAAPVWMLPGLRFPFAAPASLRDPLGFMRLMGPMLEAMTPMSHRSFRYH